VQVEDCGPDELVGGAVEVAGPETEVDEVGQGRAGDERCAENGLLGVEVMWRGESAGRVVVRFGDGQVGDGHIALLSG
jgi:hypothetical protein